MPVHRITYSGEFPVIELDGSGLRTIDATNIKVAGGGGQLGKNERLKAGLQLLLDQRTPLADLSADDPHKTTDPATAIEFWDGQGNIVTRHVIVDNVTWDGTKYILTLRRNQ